MSAQWPVSRLWLYLRATLFWIMFIVSVLIFAPLLILSKALPLHCRLRIALVWNGFVLWCLKFVCGLRYRVDGQEHLPKGPAIVFAKHQSTWETVALADIIPPHVWVLKRELLRIPFFGWALAALAPIAIDRSAGRQAVKQVIEQGRERLGRGLWVVVFPEGTRVQPGTSVRYKLGGAVLAAETGVPVVPVAHNAGEFWPRRSYIKWPGEITVSIGPPIQSTGRPPLEINAQAQAWIEGKMSEISQLECSRR